MSSFRLDEREKAKQFASYFKVLEDRLESLERSNQLNYASIEGGTLDIYDEDGELKGSVGMQDDGTVALVPDPENTEPPPTPSPPTVEPALAGLDVTWAGDWIDAETAPNDLVLVQVHIGASADFTPDAATQVSQISDVTGGKTTVRVAGYEPVWVRLVAVNTAALTGDPSEAVQGQARQAVGQDLIDGIVTEVKIANEAITEAKIALSAVTSDKLAAGSVKELALADDAVTAAKVAANAIDSTKITDAAVTAAKIGAAAVTAGKLAAQAVTLATLSGALADGVAQRWVDTMGDPSTWTVAALSPGGAFDFLTGVTDAQTGQSVGQATGFARLRGNARIPYDPDVLYRISARVRMPQAGASDSVYVGVLGIGADGVTLVNREGADSVNTHYYAAASGKAVANSDGWVTVIGFLKGRAAPGVTGSAGPNNDPRSAGLVNDGVRFISPYVWLNYNQQSGGSSRMQVDYVAIETLKTGVVDPINLSAGAVTAPAIAADAVIAGKIAADAITTRELAANSVTAAELAAGSVTAAAIEASTITAGQLAANSVTATQIAAGSVQTAALAADAVAAGKIAADAITARELAANAVTADKILANAVTADKIVGLSITGDKIAANAITTDKIAALSVTAEQLAANSVTATAIEAGAIEATHIKSGAITAEKLDANAINGKTITGATMQTAETGPRVVMDGSLITAYGDGEQRMGLQPDFLVFTGGGLFNHTPRIYWTSDDGSNQAWMQASGNGDAANLYTYSGRFTDSADSVLYRWRTRMGKDEWSVERVQDSWTVRDNNRGTPRITLNKTSATVFAPAINARGVFSADNIVSGRVSITPSAANTPTPTTVTGLGLSGSGPRVLVTPVTSVPGTTVLGVGYTDVSTSSMTIWLTRSNTTNTSIDYLVIAS